MHVNTYPVLVYEFYSSLMVAKSRIGPVSYVTYRLLNQDFRVTLQEFARILCVLCQGEIGYPRNYHHCDTYYAIMGDENDFTLQHGNTKFIHQPLIIWVRFISKTLFGRSEGQLIRGDGLYLTGSYMFRGTYHRFHYNIPHHVALPNEAYCHHLP